MLQYRHTRKTIITHQRQRRAICDTGHTSEVVQLTPKFVLDRAADMRALTNASCSLGRVRLGLTFGLTLGLYGCGDGEAVGQLRTRYDATIDVVTDVATIDCPEIESYTISPFRHVAGADVIMEVSTTRPQGATPFYSWMTTSGDFSDPTSSATIYRCGPERASVVTFTIWYLSCEASVDISMDCT